MEWKVVENSNENKPVSVEFEGDIVRVRKEYEIVPIIDDHGEITGRHWRYLERRMTSSEYDVFSTSEQQRADIDYIAMETGVEL